MDVSCLFLNILFLFGLQTPAYELHIVRNQSLDQLLYQSATFVKETSKFGLGCPLFTVQQALTRPWSWFLTTRSWHCLTIPWCTSHSCKMQTGKPMKTTQLQVSGPHSWISMVSRTKMSGCIRRWSKLRFQQRLCQSYKSKIKDVVSTISKMAERIAIHIALATDKMVAREISDLVPESLDDILPFAYDSTRSGVCSDIYIVIKEVLLHLLCRNLICRTLNRHMSSHLNSNYSSCRIDGKLHLTIYSMAAIVARIQYKTS